VHLPWGGVWRHYEIDPGRIIYRDRHLLAYDKEAGVPSQQTPADAYNNLFAALRRYLERRSPHAYVALHHRLDRETSGVMVFALDRSVNQALNRAFQEGEVLKDYLAWVEGCPEQSYWRINEDIGRVGGRYVACPRGTGKRAETAVRVLYRERARALVWARPLTGRTHQIRLHLSYCGYPVLGDRLSGGKPAGRLHLHAYRLLLPHPSTRSRLILIAPPPPDWPCPPDWSQHLPESMERDE
jgi:23S rRNA pseudouridine1911/1915/1917 synthase